MLNLKPRTRKPAVGLRESDLPWNGCGSRAHKVFDRVVGGQGLGRKALDWVSCTPYPVLESMEKVAFLMDLLDDLVYQSSSP